MSHIRLHPLLAAAVLPAVLACGAAPEDGPLLRSLKLSAVDGALRTAAPSRVSVAFTVETDDGKPVPGLSTDAFEILEDGQSLSAFEGQRSIQPRGEKSRMYSLLLLDLSGSILRSGEFPKVQEAAAAYVNRVLAESGDGQKVAIFSFDGRAAITQVVGFTGDRAALNDGLSRLSARECSTNADCAGHADRRTCAAWLCVDESTNLNGAVISALEQLEASVQADTAVQFKEGALVVFTDGTDQAARATASQTREAVRRSSAHVFTVGLGGEVDLTALSDFGKDGYQPVARAAELQVAFDEIAGKVSAMANRFYVLDYCSPKRSGQHELTVRARWTLLGGELLSGSLSQRFDAEGFESGCELGGAATAR